MTADAIVAELVLKVSRRRVRGAKKCSREYRECASVAGCLGFDCRQDKKSGSPMCENQGDHVRGRPRGWREISEWAALIGRPEPPIDSIGLNVLPPIQLSQQSCGRVRAGVQVGGQGVPYQSGGLSPSSISG